MSGKLAGKLGVVESVSTKFKINLADYQRVISKASGSIHGTYESILDIVINAFSEPFVIPRDLFDMIAEMPSAYKMKEEEE